MSNDNKKQVSIIYLNSFWLFACALLRFINLSVLVQNDIFSLFLAHLSQRLICGLIGYPWSGVRRRPYTISNVFVSEIAWPIKAKFYVEPPWEGGTKVCINGTGNMTKMAATPIYGKNP